MEHMNHFILTVMNINYCTESIPYEKGLKQKSAGNVELGGRGFFFKI